MSLRPFSHYATMAEDQKPNEVAKELDTRFVDDVELHVLGCRLTY